ncbi:MAG: MFS transporter [Dehalococcoidia bacterium]|nr:MFS transporter [Dehalococcoidia bacterium]
MAPATEDIQASPLARVGERLGRVRTLQSLTYRNYRYLWAGVICTGITFGMEFVALAWYVYQATDSPLLVGALQGVRIAPMLIFGPLGGVLADRFDRRRLMILANTITGACALILGLLLVTGEARLWHVFLLSALTGAAFAFGIPPRQALLPNLVERRHLMNAVALQIMAFQLTAVVAPAIAGVMVERLNTGAVFLVNAGLFALVVLFTTRVRLPAQQPAPTTESMFAHFGQGLSYVAREPTMRTVLALGFFVVVFGMPVTTLLPVFARDLFQVGSSGLGYMNSALGLGAFIATATVASLGNLPRRGWVLIGGCLGLGLGLLLFGFSPLLPGGLALGIIALMLAGAGQFTFVATMDVIIQLGVPDHLRGRVMSIVSLTFGMTPLGNLLAGAVAGVSTASMAAWSLSAVVLSAGAYSMAFVKRLRSV